jgi:membrane protease YdiL (CAAX protease family)
VNDPDPVGPPRGDTPGPQAPAGVLAIVGYILLAAVMGTIILVIAIGGADVLARPILRQMPDVSLGATVSVSLLVMQVLIVVAVLAAPGLLQSAAGTLPLGWPRLGPNTLSLIAWTTVAFMAVSYFLAFTVFRTQFVADLKTFAPLLQSEAWPVAVLSVAIGAPVAEEFLFRGLLLGWLLQRGVPFWTAAVATTIMWTLLHLGYSVVGLIEVFLAGLLLSWVFWLTRSVWLPIMVHATYNMTALVVMFTLVI